MLNRIRALWSSLFADRAPKSMMQQARMPRPKRKSSTENLYVLEVDFSVGDEMQQKLDTAMDYLREVYSVDFMMLEPGMKLRRFDDY